MDSAELILTVGLIHIRGQRLLLVRPKGKQAFYFPGGKYEPGESDETALAREVAEELGCALRPQSARWWGTVEDEAYGHGPGVRVRVACYQGELDGEPAAQAEIAELAYFTAQAYLTMPETAPAVRQVVQSLAAAGEIRRR